MLQRGLNVLFDRTQKQTAIPGMLMYEKQSVIWAGIWMKSQHRQAGPQI